MTDAFSPEDLVADLAGPVATITFDRPDKLNAVRRQTRAELAEALRRASDDPAVRVIVLTGNGRAFTAGQDLDELQADLAGPDLLDRARVDLGEFADLTRVIIGSPKVTIAALGGVAVGLGAELAIACDLRIATASARLGFVEVTRGLFETNGVTFLLPRIVGHGRAAELMLSGRIIDAAELERIGLVSRVVPDDELVATTAELAGAIAANAPRSLGLVKDAMRRTWSDTLESAMAFETDGMLACLQTEDLRAGTDAFVEGREARYDGR